MPFRRRRHPLFGLIEDRPLVLAFVLVLGAGILAGVTWWWADGNRDRATDDPALLEMFASGKALENEYLSIAAVRDPTSEDIALLGKAVENQRNWMRAIGGNDPVQIARLRQMEATFETARARQLATTSREAEGAARIDIDAGRSAGALPKLEVALEAQRELNRGHPRAEYRDLPRESQLAHEVEALRVEPFAIELAASIAKAGEAAAAGRRDEALAAWRSARETQARINREFPRVRHADLVSLDRIDIEIDTLASEPHAEEIAGLQRQATDAAARGRVVDAATLFGEAAALQRAINTDSPRSRHVSTERLDLLEIERQTALGATLTERIAGIDRELTALLAAGDVTAALSKIAEGGAAMDELASRYPRSRQADPGLRLKFDYLTTVRETLAATVAQVRERVAPVPGIGSVMMFRTEVPQILYESVMSSNPSRAAGQQYPVDSVSWHDAADFCRRLSWIVGQTVRLPSENEFRAAVGDDASESPDGLVWRPPVSDLRPRSVSDGAANPRGFSDLLGNVSEWLDAAGAVGGESAPVAGGSFNDVPDASGPLPIEMRARNDRSRATGFRFVIEAR
ncbi:MAG TPA: SUMF1/EgtB/PvdO family nonheme iron enzyme [Opitutaceae bacterium]|nr:SUMF1/EgtB/PvdO family nonheme iron enzyme [Opitutaceae bacterium]